MLSICLPTYNRLPWLKQALGSVFNQGWGGYPFEVVVADGGSSDGTLEYLYGLRFDNLKIIEEKKPSGMASALNACFKKCDGDFVFIGNDDAIIRSGVFVDACRTMEEYSGIGLVAPKDIEVKHGGVHGVTLSRMKHFWLLLGKFNMLRRSIIGSKPVFYEPGFNTYYLDDDSCLTTLSQGYSIYFTRDVGVIHFRVDDSNTNKAKQRNYDKVVNSGEYGFFLRKWGWLKRNIGEYLGFSGWDRFRVLRWVWLCDRMYQNRFWRCFSPLYHGWYDFCLSRAVVFPGENVDGLFLGQRFPDEVLR